jgi:hypothetical protein
VIRIRITHRDPGSAWAGFAGYHPRAIERRLVRLTGRGRADVKRLVRQLRDRQCIALAVPGPADQYAVESLRSLLESLGAAVQIEAT